METQREKQSARKPFRAEVAIEVEAPADEVYQHWMRLEEFPGWMESVRRTKRIGEQRSLWDVDILGRQVVWEAQLVENVPAQRIRWTSRWGARHSGEVRFEPAGPGRTRVVVFIDYGPRGLVEHLGAYLGLVDLHVQRDLALFRRAVEQRLARRAA